MKKLGLLLSLLLIAGITIAQTEVNRNVLSKADEIKPLKKSQAIEVSKLITLTQIPNTKRVLISSAARKSSLELLERGSANVEGKASVKGIYKSAHARKPATSNTPPKINIPTIPPQVITKPNRIAIPNRKMTHYMVKALI